MIIITRSNGIYSSPRIEKYLDFFLNKGIESLAIGWDRDGNNLKRRNTIYYRKACGYNLGGLKAVFYRISWMAYLITIFYKNRRLITTIHAFDLDTAFPACIYKVLFNNQIKVIFDICDWFSDTLFNQNKFIRFVFKRLERYSIKHSDEVIICEPERIEQIPYKLNSKEIIVPNIPSFNNTSFLFYENKFKFENDKIIISYVGGFNKFRLLNELLDIAQKGIINLLIAGYGDNDIEKRCDILNSLPNIKYFGKVKYKDGLNIMYNSDLIYAMYSKSNPNHYYAAPNKYYESMMLGKPILTTKGINLGIKVLNNNLGYAISENPPDLESFINNLDKQDMENKGKVASTLWEVKYKNYIIDFLNNKYSCIIQG